MLMMSLSVFLFLFFVLILFDVARFSKVVRLIKRDLRFEGLISEGNSANFSPQFYFLQFHQACKLLDAHIVCLSIRKQLGRRPTVLSKVALNSWWIRVLFPSYSGSIR